MTYDVPSHWIPKLAVASGNTEESSIQFPTESIAMAGDDMMVSDTSMMNSTYPADSDATKEKESPAVAV
jgi:hypothetical protein